MIYKAERYKVLAPEPLPENDDTFVSWLNNRASAGWRVVEIFDRHTFAGHMTIQALVLFEHE